MAEQASEAAVLFADISGSTKLYESAGNAVAHAAVENCVNLMRQKTEAAKGRVVKTIGDEVMAIFPRADDAADAAIEMQLAVSALPPVGETALGIRVGFDYGAVLERDGEFFGDAVSLASRLVGVATKGQIITARDTVMLMSPMLKACTRAITTIQVQGKAQHWQDTVGALSGGQCNVAQLRNAGAWSGRTARTIQNPQMAMATRPTSAR